MQVRLFAANTGARWRGAVHRRVYTGTPNFVKSCVRTPPRPCILSSLYSPCPSIYKKIISSSEAFTTQAYNSTAQVLNTHTAHVGGTCLISPSVLVGEDATAVAAVFEPLPVVPPPISPHHESATCHHVVYPFALIPAHRACSLSHFCSRQWSCGGREPRKKRGTCCHRPMS